jgi:hypothetical protein
VLSPDLCAFLQSGCALIVGTVDAAGEPCGSRAWGCQVVDPAGELRVLLPSDDATALANLATTQRIALTAADPLTLRSAQLKGRVSALEPPSAADRARSSRYVEAFFEIITALDGLDRDLVERVVPAELVAVDVTVEASFDQTPGPSAGTLLMIEP